MNPQNILSLIPQQHPFVMVDTLLRCDENFTQTTFRVSSENLMVMNGVFTEAGLLENIAQTAAAAAGYKAMMENKPVALGYIGAVKNFEVFSLPKINDEIVTETSIRDQVFTMAVVSGTIKHKDVLLAQCEMNIFAGK